ncbi:hypothetical protein KSS87_010575, partial [Heliosperma pusillum]
SVSSSNKCSKTVKPNDDLNNKKWTKNVIFVRLEFHIKPQTHKQPFLLLPAFSHQHYYYQHLPTLSLPPFTVLMDDTTVTNGLNRRNSVPSAVILPNGNNNHHHHRLRHLNSFELVSLKFPTATPSYTSLKDIIPSSPSSILSPSPATNSAGGAGAITSPTSGSGYEISIRNRLVKQAAWAYLQPTVPSSPSSSSPCLCFSREFFRPIESGFRQLLCETATRVYDWLVDVMWLILCR